MQPIHPPIRLLALALALGTILFGITAVATLARPVARSGAAPLVAGSASIRLTAPDEAVTQGSSFSVALDATGLGDALSAFQVDVAFDPAILTFNGVTPGTLLGSTGRATVCPPAETSPGRVRFACASAGAAAGVSSPGLLATLNFTARSPGSSSLALEGVQLVDGSRPPAAFSVNSRNASVTIAGPAAPTATPTTTPTTAPTTTPTTTPTATPTAITPKSFDLFLPKVDMSTESSRESIPKDEERVFLPAVGR